MSPTCDGSGVTSSDSAVEAGWYPHPTAPDWEAYWSGSSWESQVRPLCRSAEVRAQGMHSEEKDGGANARGLQISNWLILLCAVGCIGTVCVIVVPFLPTGSIRPVDVGLLAIGVCMLLATAVLAAAVLRIEGTAATIAAVLVLSAAIVVLISYGLSLFDAYHRWTLVCLQTLALMMALGVWLSNDRPRPGIRTPTKAELRQAMREHPYVVVIVGALVFAAMVEAVLALGVVPNNYDSMYYHLARIGYWLENDSVFQFYGGSIFQLQHPPNAELLQAWTMELTRGDRFAQFVQWTALWGLVCVTYSGARLLRFSRSGSLFAAAVFGTLPLPVLEASSTINDLVSAFFVCAAALFMIRGISATSIGDVVVGAASLGLAIGTKGTVLLAVPALVVLVGCSLWRWRPSRRFLAVGALVSVLATLALGSPNYLQTAINTGSPIGEQGSVKHRVEPLPQSAMRTMWTFVDFPGKNAFPPLSSLLARGDRAVWGPDRPGVSGGVDVNEYFTGYGPIGFLLLLPLLAFTLARRNVSVDRRLLAASAGSYILLFLILVAAQPFDMRLMMIPMALGAPLLAYAAGIPWLRWLTVGVAVLLLIPVLFANQVKPLHPGEFSLGKDLASQRANANIGFDEMLRNTEQAIADDDRVGFIGSDLDWDYPLFGPHFDRYVVRLPELTTGREASSAMRQYDLDAIVWATEPPAGVSATRVSSVDAGGQHTDRWVQEAGSAPVG